MEIKSTGDFLSKCLSNPLLQKEDITVFYRGVNRIFKENAHVPSLYYPPGNSIRGDFYKDEDKIYKEFVSHFPEEMAAQRLTIEKLFIMRHYGYPTRLLDISKNPLVDLFFACFADKGQEDANKEDGVVYVYAVPTEAIKFSDGDTVAFLANICKLPNTGKHPLNKDHDEALDYLAYEVSQERLGFDQKHLRWDSNGLNQVVCLRPRMNNPRIIRQHGYFFLFGINGEKKNCAKLPDEWIKGSIVIRSEYKKFILKELASMGYDEGFFYPDFEHVNNVIRRHYGIARK